MPINKAAAQFLGDKTPLVTVPAVLSLIRLGLHNGIVPVPVAPGYPDLNRMNAQVDAMTFWEPGRAVKFLTNPESPEDTVLMTEDLVRRKHWRTPRSC